MGKTEKEKAKDKEKSKTKAMSRDKVPKALKGGDGPKRKKWSKSKQKEKLNNQVYWTKPLHDKLMRDIIGKETYITTSMISDKLKVNMSVAREAIKELRETEQIIPASEYHSVFCTYVRGPKYVAPSAAEKGAKGAQEKKAPAAKKPEKKK